jgi:hypothetical protein
MQPPSSYRQGEHQSPEPQHHQPKAPDDPVAEAEAALKKLKEHPDDKQAADALEQALKRLKERTKPEGQTGNPEKKP